MTDKKRFRIGFFTHVVHQKYQMEMLSGVVAAAVKHDADIIRFSFEIEYSYYRMEKQMELLSQIADNLELDGLLYLGWIGEHEKIKSLLYKSASIPIVLLGGQYENFPSVYQDGKKYIHELITHFVEHHNYKRIVFIEPVHPDHRTKDYIDKMTEYGIFNPDYIVWADDIKMRGQWDFTERTTRIYDVIFKQRKLKVDAIMSMHADESVFMIENLNQHNLRVPEDIAVTSWEESELCRYNDPAITTVYFPFYEIGYTGCDLLAEHLSGKAIKWKTAVPSRILYRKSCGCSQYAMEKAALEVTSTEKDSILTINEDEINKVIGSLRDHLSVLKAEELFSSFSLALRNRKSNLFCIWLEDFIRARNPPIEQLYFIQDELMLFRQHVKAYIIDNKELNLTAEEIWIKSQIIIGNWIEKIFGVEERNKFLYNLKVEELGLMLITTFNIDRIKLCLDEHLSKIRVPSCFIYKITLENNQYKAELLYGFQKNKNIFGNDNQNGADIGLNASMMFYGGRRTYLVHILHIKDTLIGCAFYEYGIADDRVYLTLSTQLSSALEGAKVLEELQKSNKELLFAQDKILNQMEIINQRTNALEQSNLKLSNLDNLKNDFIANITHEFRSPLMIILNNTDLGLKYDNNSLVENIKRRYNIIYESGLKLKSTIDRLLELAKLDAQGIKIHVKNIPVKNYLESITDFFRSAVINTRIKVMNFFEGREVYIHTDPDILEDVLNNVISNAMKFIDPELGEIRIGLEEKEESIRIYIADNGIGIPPDKLEMIFGRFEQIDSGRNNRFKGTGIGLAFSRQLVSYLKGKIWAESSGTGTGAKFIIELKKGQGHFNNEELARESVNHSYEEQRRFELKKIIEIDLRTRLDKAAIKKSFLELNKENEFDPKKGIILIADDNSQIREIMFEYFSNNGYRNIILASDGQQGVDAAYQYRPDLIICDYNMPNMRGDQFHDELCNNPDFKKIPFIFLTAIADKDIMIERKKKGAAAYLSKPIDESDLMLTAALHLNNYMELKSTLYQATTDELTGINNKSSVIKLLKNKLAINRLRDISLIFFDLDHFKLVNDTYGHQTGDLVLREIGTIIREIIRPVDFAGRYGGEEFLIALPETSATESLLTAESLRKRISETVIIHDNKEIRVTASFGISSLIGNKIKVCEELNIPDLKNLFSIDPDSNVKWEEIETKKNRIPNILISLADMALYMSKRTTCKSCFFHSGKDELFVDKKCPECGSRDLKSGRNKSTILPDIPE